MPTPNDPTTPSQQPEQQPAPADGEVTSENAADILAADDAEDTAPARKGTSRRNLLIGGGVAVAALAVGGGWWATRSNKGSDGLTGASEEIKLVIGGDICAAPLYAAYHQGYFDDANLNVKLVRTQLTEDAKDAVGSGKYTGAPGIFFSWLEPIYNGLDARLAGGFHSGCLRMVVGNDSPITSLADLKGKRIGVPSLASSAFAYFSIGLTDAGIAPDPKAGQITWTTVDQDSLGTALADGTVDAITGSDPGALLPVLKGTAHELANNDDAAFCCSVALNGTFVKEHRAEAKALTEAWFKGSDWLAAGDDHLAEMAKTEVDNDYVATDEATVLKVLKTYGWNASAVDFRKAIEPGIGEFKKTGFISSSIDAKTLADKVYVDLGITR